MMSWYSVARRFTDVDTQPMQPYLDLMKDVLANGHDRPDRTGIGTRSVFGRQLRFDLAQGFPLLTTKKLHIHSIIHELLWFLAGSTNIGYLQQHQVRIWDAWADQEGNLGPVYGKQWRSWQAPDGRTVDQISQVVHLIKHNPASRRMMVIAYNPGEIEQMALPPCHVLFQFYVAAGRLSCHLYQRSADLFLGVPFNIASYSLLTCMIAQQCDLQPGEFIHSFGDCHLYHNHIQPDIVYTQLQRKPGNLPQLIIRRRPPSVFAYQYEDFMITGYRPHPAIQAPVAV